MAASSWVGFFLPDDFLYRTVLGLGSPRLPFHAFLSLPFPFALDCAVMGEAEKV
jgi:hypothetical protein